MTDDQTFDRFKEQILKDGPRLGADDKFSFECHKGLDCFNRCCHDVNIFLTPYDVLRIKEHLGISSESFLDRYCIIPFSRNQKYPVVVLRMEEDDEKSCPFLREPEGCSIYEDRPWSCRIYPLGRAAPPKGGDEGGTFYFLLKEEHCLGSEANREWTVAQWLSDQGVEEYDRAGEQFQEIVQHERLQGENVLTPEAMDMLFMVCYDIDRFRRFIFESKFLKMFQVAGDTLEALRTDDEALMKFGFDWIRFALWQEPTMKIRDEVIEAKKAAPGANKAKS